MRLMLLLSIMCSSCALVPNELRPELEHMSHITQHEPFTDHPTNYGANWLSVLAVWHVGAHGYVEVGDGISLDARRDHAVGEIIGPREEFTARVGYSFEVQK